MVAGFWPEKVRDFADTGEGRCYPQCPFLLRFVLRQVWLQVTERTSFSCTVGLVSLWQPTQLRGKVCSYESRLITPCSELQHANQAQNKFYCFLNRVSSSSPTISNLGFKQFLTNGMSLCATLHV